MTAIPSYFFADCVNLKTFDWTGITSIGQYAFLNTGLTAVTLPSSVTSVGDYAFQSSPLLVRADFSAVNIAAFSSYCIRYCSSLKVLILPTTATTWSRSLTQSTGNPPKSAADSLERIVIPAGMTTIDQLFSYSTTAGPRPANLVFEVDPGNTVYETVLNGKGLVQKDGGAKTLLFCPSAAGAVTIPEGIAIDRYAFAGTNVGSVTIPDSIASIPSYAFQGCRELTSVTLGSGVTEIPTYAFSTTPKLETITIPGNVKTIELRAFDKAGTEGAGFTVVFEEGLTTISNEAFYGSGLVSITSPASLTSIGTSSFYACERLISIDFSASAITSMTRTAFRNCTSLASVTLPAGLTEIGNNAFHSCTALTQISLPSGLLTVVDGAFNGTRLTSVTIPESLTNIGSNAFVSTTLEWVKILKTDGLLSIPSSASSFPFKKTSSTYPAIYVPDELYTQYAGDTETGAVSQWTGCPAGAVSQIRPMSQFATDYSGQ
jgi:hypothetical protein